MLPDIGLVILVTKLWLQRELGLGWRCLLAGLLLLDPEVLIRAVAMKAGMAFRLRAWNVSCWCLVTLDRSAINVFSIGYRAKARS